MRAAVEGIQEVKQRRLLKRSTLEIIIKILECPRTFSSGSIARAAGIAPRTVHQTLKRLRHEGWLACETESEAGHSGRRPIIYGLTVKGRKEARAALMKQASFTGGKWQIDARIQPQRVRRARLKSDVPAVR